MKTTYNYIRPASMKMVYGIEILLALIPLFFAISDGFEGGVPYVEIAIPLFLIVLTVFLEKNIFQKNKIILNDEGVEICSASSKEFIKYDSISEVKFDSFTPNMIINYGFNGKLMHVIPSSRFGKQQMAAMYGGIVKAMQKAK